MPKNRRTPYIPILTGVTLAFVLASAGFIFLMLRLNNPFVQVAEIPVPALVGMKLDTAKIQYSEITINVEEYGYSDEYAKGVIYEQKPKSGGPDIKVTTPIEVKVSNGPKKVTLENFAGQGVEQVMQKLREDGLEPREEREFSSEVPAGYVIYTDPSKGSELLSGTAVTVYVSQGPKEKLVEVPRDIIGMNIDQAIQYLVFTTLRIGNVTEELSDMPAGTIIAIDPEGLQPEGTAINVVVSKGGGAKAELAVPMPDMDAVITINVRNEEGDLLLTDSVDTRETSVWRPVIEGQEGERLTVRIFISIPDEMPGKRYQNYEIDFGSDPPTYELDSDRSDAPEFNP